MILVVCDVADASVTWAAGALSRRGLSPCVLTGADLAGAREWRHTIGPDGAARVSVHLGNGLVIRDTRVRGVLNRLTYLPMAWTARVGGPDRDYAMQEMFAFYLSWLHALPGPKLNPPTPQGLCGNMRHVSTWVAMATREGLPVHPFHQSERDDPAAGWQPKPAGAATVIVAGRRVVGPQSLVWRHYDACLRLAAAAGCKLLGIDFLPGGDGVWRMAGASVAPDLSDGGEALADALAEALTDGATR